MENYTLHALDMRTNFWALWTESDALRRYNEKYPRAFERLRANLGYRLRPAWVWQRKRYGTSELIVCVANRGVAGVPGVLWLEVETPDGKFTSRGALDAGYPHGGGLREASFLLPQGYVGKIQLAADLEIRPGVMRRVAWACEQPVNANGSIDVEVKPFDDRGWRKGV